MVEICVLTDECGPVADAYTEARRALGAWTRAISGGFDVRPATQAEIAGAGEVSEGTVHRWVETLPAPFVESLGGAIGVISLV